MIGKCLVLPLHTEVWLDSKVHYNIIYNIIMSAGLNTLLGSAPPCSYSGLESVASQHIRQLSSLECVAASVLHTRLPNSFNL